MSKIQLGDNTALGTITDYHRENTSQYLQSETDKLPIKNHLKMHALQLRQQSQHPQHTFHSLISNNQSQAQEANYL